MATQLFEIQTDKIENGLSLMYSNTALSYWYGDLSSLTNGERMFHYCTNLTAFRGNLDSLTNGDYMFSNCTKLESFTQDSNLPIDLSFLRDGSYMFCQCVNLPSFTSTLSSLSNGYLMFGSCSKLATFRSDLNSLDYGNYMFEGCSNLKTFDTDLSYLVNASNMFYNCSNLESFNSKLSSLTHGGCMFQGCYKLSQFNSDLSSLLEGAYMFYGCVLDAPSVQNIALTINKISTGGQFHIGVSSSIVNNAQVKRDLGLIKHKGWNIFVNGSNGTNSYTLPKYAGCTTAAEIATKDANYKTNNIVNGVCTEHLPDLVSAYVREAEGLFYDCSNLISFNADLSSLTNGYWMFYGCSNLTSFTSNLSNLTDGLQMFMDCLALTSFTSDLPNLTNGQFMFLNCPNLTSFDCNGLSNLTNGEGMFSNCASLTSFSSDLSSLTNGEWMFSYCKLDTASVQNIADTINTYNGTIYIGIGNTTPNAEETAAFNAMVSKGWTVYVQGNGGSESQWNPTSLTPIDGEEISTPIPFYAKPIQSNEEHAHYTDSEGNYYNILGGQFIFGDDLSTYGMFTCEDDAAANMHLTKIEK